MSKRIPKLLVIDMLVCLEKILDYTAGMTYESFLADSKTQDAVIRNIQVLAEAANRVPDHLEAKTPRLNGARSFAQDTSLRTNMMTLTILLSGRS